MDHEIVYDIADTVLTLTPEELNLLIDLVGINAADKLSRAVRGVLGRPDVDPREKTVSDIINSSPELLQLRDDSLVLRAKLVTLKRQIDAAGAEEVFPVGYSDGSGTDPTQGKSETCDGTGDCKECAAPITEQAAPADGEWHAMELVSGLPLLPFGGLPLFASGPFGPLTADLPFGGPGTFNPHQARAAAELNVIGLLLNTILAGDAR